MVLSWLALAGCACAAGATAIADRLPRALDRYMRLRHGNATPVVIGDVLYAAGAAITALDAGGGDVLWESEPLASLGCLAVHEGVVSAGGSTAEGEQWLALDAATGGTLWRRPLEAACQFNRPAFDPASGMLVAGTQNGLLLAYAADSGQPAWRFQTGASLEANAHVQEGVVFATYTSGHLFAVEAASGRLLANYRPGTPIETLAGPLVTATAVCAP